MSAKISIFATVLSWFDNEATQNNSVKSNIGPNDSIEHCELPSRPDQPIAIQADTLQADKDAASSSIDFYRVIPFVLIHLACFALIWVGWSWFAVLFAIALYALRMFAITGFYHRYFAHKAFQTSRAGQFIFAVLGAMIAIFLWGLVTRNA